MPICEFFIITEVATERWLFYGLMFAKKKVLSLFASFRELKVGVLKNYYSKKILEIEI